MKKIKKKSVIILDFGSQYTQLIARRVREQNVYSEVLSPSVSLDIIKSKALRQLFYQEGQRVFLMMMHLFLIKIY